MSTQEITLEPLKLPVLPYPTNALEPYIDQKTMEIHHGKHHKAYVENLNKAVSDNKIEFETLEELCKNISKYPMAVRNNGGGHYNHTFFWKSIGPAKGESPKGEIAQAIDKTFISFDEFKKQFEKAALDRFGSGWAWLVVDSKGELKIGSTPNQDNPLMDVSELKGTPLLGLDVWEHAYYLKYQNRRAEYASAFWNVVNWDEVNNRFKQAKG